jgi:predicted RNase H-like nuclease
VPPDWIAVAGDCGSDTLSSVQIVGVDVCRGAWVAVALVDGAFAEARVFAELAALAKQYADARAVAVDVPIGLVARGRRRADEAARAFLAGGRLNSVFFVPSRSVLEAQDYVEARARAAALGDPGTSAQAYQLRHAIFEAEAVAASDPRLREIHPEVTFAAMAGRQLTAAKKTWNGLGERLELLEQGGIRLPRHLHTLGAAGIDDVVDAAAAAWSAARIAAGTAGSLPDPPEIGPTGEQIAIWY